MEKVLSLYELSGCFSVRAFALMCALLAGYFGYKLLSFEPEYRCSLILQSPGHSELMGTKATWLLRDRVAVLTDQSVYVEQRGDLLHFSSKSMTQDGACSRLFKVLGYVTGQLNSQVPGIVEALRDESRILGDFFTALLQKGAVISEKTAYWPDQDKTLADLLRRKIQVDRMLADPSLLGFKIVRNIEPGASPRLHFVTRHTISLFGMALIMSALIAFVAGYFRLLLKSEVGQ